MSTSRIVETVVVDYQREWNKWPDTSDVDYNDVLSRRVDREYDLDGERVTVRIRYYPVHRAYATAGFLHLLHPHPHINNTVDVPSTVVHSMIQDLADAARDGCRLCIWNHARHCYPAVAARLKDTFAHSVVFNADDCPSSVAIRTGPVGMYFDSAIHLNVTWTEDGKLTRDLYRGMGVMDTHYVSLHPTDGVVKALNQAGPFDLDKRVHQLTSGDYAYDLAFVGECMNRSRGVLNKPETTRTFEMSGVRTAVYGRNMRDGVLPCIGAELLGEPVGRLYLRSFGVMNPPFVGLLATRAHDAWATGTLLFQHDTVGELSQVGVEADVHYADYDGTIPGLVDKVRSYQRDPQRIGSVVRDGNAMSVMMQKKYSFESAMTKILRDNRHKWGW